MRVAPLSRAFLGKVGWPQPETPTADSTTRLGPIPRARPFHPPTFAGYNFEAYWRGLTACIQFSAAPCEPLFTPFL
jgi:hypothetical protein